MNGRSALLKAMRMTGCGAFAVLSALLATPLSAADINPLLAAVGSPEDLTLRASVRSREEAVAGQFRPGTARQDFLWSLRTDIFAEYHPGAFRVGVELRDARGYQEHSNSSAGVSEVNALEPLQAYLGLTLQGIVADGSVALLTAGRYTLELGSGRLVGRPDFTNSVNSYTGGMLDWTSRRGDHLVLFANLPSTRLPNAPDAIHVNRQELDGARFGYRFIGADFTKFDLLFGDTALETYLYSLTERDAPTQATKNRHLLTYGGRLFRRPRIGNNDFELEVARQSGHERVTTLPTDRTNTPVEAYLVHAEIGHKFTAGWTPRVSLHADLATGDDADPRRITRFDTLFGANRVDFGPSGLYGALTRSNLQSLGVRFEVTPSKRADAFVMTRWLRLDSPTDAFAQTGVRDRDGRSGRDAGIQIEGRLRYWIVPKLLHTDIGGALLAKGRFLTDAPNAPTTGDTRYLFVDVQVDL